MKLRKQQGSIDIRQAASLMGRIGGSSTSSAKQSASRENGKKGGRPPKALSQLSESGKYQRARRERLRSEQSEVKGE